MSDIKVGDVMMHRYQSREFPKPVQVKGKITQILYEFTPDDMTVMDGPVTVTAARLSKTVSGGARRRRTRRRKNGTQKKQIK